MLTAHRLAKSFVLDNLFSDVTFSINNLDRLALVGPNGSGKSTLLRILTGELEPDEGQVTIEPGVRLGYLPQGFTLEAEQSIASVIGKVIGDATALEHELVALSHTLMSRPDDVAVQRHYDRLLQRIATADSGRAASVLAGLGLGEIPDETPVGTLSGGQKTRLNLALVLLDDPQLLLLDEPTNHLDIGMLEWLEEWLMSFAGGTMVVSHDRHFLDRSATRILALDPLTRTAREFEGNYSTYEEIIELERQKQWSAYLDQQQEIRRVKEDIQRTKQQASFTEKQASSVRIGGEIMAEKGRKDYERSIAKKIATKAKSRERKLERYLDSEERVEKPVRSRVLKLDLDQTPHLGRSVIELNQLSAGYDREKPLLRDLNQDVGAGARIAITGPNGSGKTTLLRTIGGRLEPLAGEVIRGPSVQLGYMAQEQSGLEPAHSALDTVQFAFANETKARTFLSYFLFTGNEALKRNDQLSYGQRARLSLALMIAEGCNVLLLDEPINHLDIPSREQFAAALDSFEGAVLTVVHDRHFIANFAGEVWWVEALRIRRELR